MKYKYFCGCCGHHFTSETPELGLHGILNDIRCPECGAHDTYPDTPIGAAQSVKDEIEHQNKTIAWQED